LPDAPQKEASTSENGFSLKVPGHIGSYDVVRDLDDNASSPGADSKQEEKTCFFS
jgi:hypothetical protein